MYLYSYPSTHAISGLAVGGAWEQFEVHLKMTIEWAQRYTPRPWSSDFGDSLGGGNRVYLEIHLEAVIERGWGYALGGHDGANFQAVIERVWRYTWRPRSSEFGDALGGRDRSSLEMHWEAEMEWTQRCLWRPWSIESGDTLGDRDRASVEMHLWAVIERVWTSTWMRSMEVRRVSLHPVVNSQPWECDEVTLPWKLLWRTGWSRSIGREVHRMLKLHWGVNSKSWEWRDDRRS